MKQVDIVEQFYQAFAQKDAEKMASCYSSEATFSDPVFPFLEGQDVGDMWRMLCKNGVDLVVTYEVVSSAKNEAVVEWKATYTFSKTGRAVVNQVRAELKTSQGKIIEHRDQFNFWKWSRQALGTLGLVLGWSQFLQSKVQRTAAGSLQSFRERKSGKEN